MKLNVKQSAMSLKKRKKFEVACIAIARTLTAAAEAID